MHDLGNSINRKDHAHTGAIFAGNILKDMGMKCKRQNRNYDGNRKS